MNVVIYARYSSHNQTEQSIEGQLKVCKEYAIRNNYTIVGEYIDRALTGTNDNRPEFQKMINDSNKKIFNAVLVYQFDRFARNRYDSATYKNKLKKIGIKVLSAKENITEDASGVLMESVLEGMAEYYSVELSQKVKRGMKINAEKCLYNGGNIPLGLCVDKEKKYQIDEETAPIVRQIFNMYINGKTMADIIRHLNEKNVKTSFGNEFNKNSIRNILINKKYIGIYSYNGEEKENIIPQIVDCETFRKAQEIMKKNKKVRARGKAKTEYLLTTKLFCGKCKEMMVGVCGTSKNGTIHNYYSCNGKRKNICDRKNIQKELIEDIVVEQAKEILTDKNIEKIANNVFQRAQKEKNNGNQKRLEKQLAQNERQKNNLLDSLKNCEIDEVRKVIFEEIAKIQKEHTEIENNIKIEKTSSIEITTEEIKKFLKNLKNGNISDTIYKKLLINSLIDRVYIYNDNITITFNVKDKQNDTIKLPAIEEIESSFTGKDGQPNEHYTNIVYYAVGFAIKKYIKT